MESGELTRLAHVPERPAHFAVSPDSVVASAAGASSQQP